MCKYLLDLIGFNSDEPLKKQLLQDRKLQISRNSFRCSITTAQCKYKEFQCFDVKNSVKVIGVCKQF